MPFEREGRGLRCVLCDMLEGYIMLTLYNLLFDLFFGAHVTNSGAQFKENGANRSFHRKARDAYGNLYSPHL